MNTQKQIILIVALTFLFVGGCAAYTTIDLPIRAEDQQDWTRDQSLERGALLFANNCRTCHGNKGEGAVGPALLNSDANFQNQDPLKLRQNRDLLQRTLSCGRAGTLMPAWLTTNGGALNAIQIQHLVDFLTSPIEVSEDGEATSHWWEEAEEFAHNLNGEVAVLVGGDTLGTIAKAHGIGPKELAAANNLPVEGRIKKGTEIKIPGFKGDPNGFTYTVYKDNETITKIADAQYVGALILADINNINYEFSEKRGVATMHIKDDNGRVIPGLAPGRKLSLPNGVRYTVSAGDTIEAIATRHGITTSLLVSDNRDLLGSLKVDDEIPFERRLDLPKLTAIVQPGQTIGTIAQLHDLKVEDITTANQLEEDAVVEAGKALTLPKGAQYVVQAGDTWATVASQHGSAAADLAQANGAQPTDSLSPEVTLVLPQIDAYAVQGQDLEAVAKGYGNVTASSLASANNVDENAVLYVGTQLKLPDDSFGSAPPDAKNTGTACVQYAVPSNIFDELSGEKTPVTPPANASTKVEIVANANDWTVTADGQAQPANKGVVLVAKGTTITFKSATGLHNIMKNGTQEGADLRQGDTRDLAFNDAGQFEIQCSYHPPMYAVVFVQ